MHQHTVTLGLIQEEENFEMLCFSWLSRRFGCLGVGERSLAGCFAVVTGAQQGVRKAQEKNL